MQSGSILLVIIPDYWFTSQASTTPGRQQLKKNKLSTNVDKKSLETEFPIAICRLTGDKWQSKTLFLAIFDPRSLIVKNVSVCLLPGVSTEKVKT